MRDRRHGDAAETRLKCEGSSKTRLITRVEPDHLGY